MLDVMTLRLAGISLQVATGKLLIYSNGRVRAHPANFVAVWFPQVMVRLRKLLSPKSLETST